MISEQQNEKISLVAIDTDSLLASLGADQMLGVLSVDEYERADNYRTAELRNRFIAGRFMLRKVIGHMAQLPPEVIEFSTGPNGKPKAIETDSKSVHFSFSRSDQYATCAIAIGRRVGLDVERVKLISDMELIAKEIFLGQQLIEWQQLPAQEQSLAFYRGWTRKEAVAKIDGRGISKGVRNIDVPIQHIESSNCGLLKLKTVDPEPSRRVNSLSAVWSEWNPFPHVLVSLATEVGDSSSREIKVHDQLNLDTERLNRVFRNASIRVLQRVITY